MINTIVTYLVSFRFINFVWMIACCCYAIKKWIVPDLKEAIIEQKNKIALFRQAIVRAQNEQKVVAEERAVQDQKGKELFTKIALWNQYITNKNTVQDQEQRSFFHQYQQYRMSQYHALELLYAKRSLQQDVLAKTVHDVTGLYDNQQSQSAFLQHILGATLEEQE